MMPFKKLSLLLFSALLIASCQSSQKTGEGGEAEEGEAAIQQLDSEEQAELKQRQDKLGGSYSQLRKLYQAQRYRELLDEASKILSKNEYDLRALSILGLYHLDRGEFGAARIFFEKALEKHKEIPGLYNNIGIILLKEANLESALLSFRKAYDLESSNPVVQANLGSIYVKYMDYAKAEPLVETAYSKMSDDVIVANNYAIVLRTQGQYDKAEAVYKKALAKDSRNISTNLNYAILLIEYMKKYQEAQQLVNKIEFLNPTDRYVLAKVRELQRKVTTTK